MRYKVSKRVLSFALAVFMAMLLCAPATAALAEPRAVEIQNHTQAGDRTAIRNVRIDGVDAPRAGAPLDGEARVVADPGASWDILVLWVSDDLRLATEAREGESYLPVLAFYVPQGYSLAGDAATVELSESLTALFGGAEVVSVYNEATGITYILPASLRDLFAASRSAAAENGERADEAVATSSGPVSAVGQNERPKPIEDEQGERSQTAGPSLPQKRSLIDIYCGQSARDALTDEDLEWLIDLIINSIEPQAVNLLIKSFPAFSTAAQNGEIGKQIGLYVFYNKGDADGVREHETAPQGALAFVSGHSVNYDGDYKFSYMLGVNVDDLLVKDLDGSSVRDEDTGKFSLARVGECMHTFENTMVHELLHAIMDDYNRTGMLGVTRSSDYVFDGNGDLISSWDRYYKLHFPNWFIEGTASAVENTYQYRADLFDALRMGSDGKIKDSFNTSMLVENYLNGKYDGKPAYFDLENCSASKEANGVGNAASAYVSGYLATLYLADLANIKNTGSSAIVLKDGSVDDVSTEKLRMGLNSILERMHKGETFDQVIADISPADASGKKLYKDTADFQNKFIKGTPTNLPNGTTSWELEGDKSSSGFVADYLNYLNYVSTLPGRNYTANGSILLPVDVDRGSALDYSKQASSEYLKIVESNREVPSTVPDSVAFAGGGKSDSDSSVKAASSEPIEPQADAKESDNGSVPVPEESSGASESADSGVEDAPQPVANEPDPNRGQSPT